jgi:predicted transcriptional regulator
MVQRCMNDRRGEIEDIIIQGPGNQERRNILKIISLAEGGASYSEILGELGLNTGRMNYHLKHLEGLVARNGERRYHLTPIGKKALYVLHSMTENLENGYEEYLNSAKATRSSGVASLVKRWFYVIIAFSVSAMFFLAFFVYQTVTAGILPQVSYYFLAGFALLVVVLLVWLRSWAERESERLQDWWDSIMDRLKGRNR